MATPRPLRSPPIAEALVDIRGTAPASPDVFEALGREFAADYPTLEAMRGMRAELKVVDGKLIPPIAEDLGVRGVRLLNKDRTAVVQFRPDGFTFNNLRVYMGGDQLLAAALNMWARFHHLVTPPVVQRVALRYINRLELPLRHGDEFKRYLTAPPELPPGAPQRVSDFLSRIVAHESENVSVIATQRMSVTGPDAFVVVAIDIDAIYHRELSTSVDKIKPVLDLLRDVKNRTFFSLLTEETVALYS